MDLDNSSKQLSVQEAVLLKDFKIEELEARMEMMVWRDPFNGQFEPPALPKSRVLRSTIICC